MSWWLAGTSMVATTFAADTPLAVTGLVAQLRHRRQLAVVEHADERHADGLLLRAPLAPRRACMTDVEFAEIRYSGKPAAFLRGFRALYLGLPINCIIIGWVNLAMVKILVIIFGRRQDRGARPRLRASSSVTSIISTLSGLWGVLIMDLFQFVLKMGMVIVLAIFSVRPSAAWTS